MHPIFVRKLHEILQARRTLCSQRGWAGVLAVLAVLLLLPHAAITIPLAALAGWLLIRQWCAGIVLDPAALVREVESVHPELHSLLRTALEIPADARLSYLQESVLNEALHGSVRYAWAEDLTAAQLRRASLLRSLGMLVLAGSLAWTTHEMGFIRWRNTWPAALKQPGPLAEAAAVSKFDVTVEPGDVEVERGNRLVVEAKFANAAPDSVQLILTNSSGEVADSQPLRPTLDPLVFGGMLSAVKQDSLYHIDFAHERSADFKITVFDYPSLTQADATITPPAYAQQPTREVKDSLIVTLLEGSTLSYRLKLNKPVASAEFFADDKHIIPLKPVSSAEPTLLTASWVPDETRRYRLHLVDDKERANKEPPWFKINVVKNQVPRLEIVFPKRDVKVSPLQELQLEAKASDDMGVHDAGVTFVINDHEQELKLSEDGQAPAKTLSLKASLALEEKGLQPLDIISYYFWAEDRDASGQKRRSMSDMFLAEVRPFDEVFKEVEPPPAKPGEPKPKSGVAELIKVQKQIVNANWRLIRDEKGGRKMPSMKADIETVLTSQFSNDEKLTTELEKAESPDVKKALEAAQKEMQAAVGALGAAAEKADSTALTAANSIEQKALRQLAKAQSLEHRVTQADPKAGSKGPSEDKDQEIAGLELKQKEQRYEQEKEASEEESTKQQENLAVLNRLKELARRQEALAEKMRELQIQLASAKTEQEKDRVAEQLKHLQEQQEQLLRDLDEVRERTEKAENAAQMAETRQELERTREKVAEANEQLKQQSLSQASAAASKAQEQLEQTNNRLRQQAAKKFGEDMKRMREQANDVAEGQKQLDEAMENAPGEAADKPQSASEELNRGLNKSKLARQIETQHQATEQLMNEMKRVSEQAETSEPLLHRQLYEALRNAQSQGIDQNFDEAASQTRYGDLTKAHNAERKVATAVDQLQQGVEKAAEAIVGSESDALRTAKSELDKLIKEAQPGKETAEGGKPTDKAGKEPAQVSKASEQANAGKPGEGNEGKEPAKDGKLAEKGSAQAPKAGQKPKGGGEWFFNSNHEQGGADGGIASPFAGDDWNSWADRLLRVEDVLTRPQLKNEASRIMDEARNLRIDARRNDEAPQAEHLQMRVVKPLIELRDRVAETLAQQNTNRPQFQLDATAVPERYRDLIRRYSEQLGSGN